MDSALFVKWFWPRFFSLTNAGGRIVEVLELGVLAKAFYIVRKAGFVGKEGGASARSDPWGCLLRHAVERLKGDRGIENSSTFYRDASLIISCMDREMKVEDGAVIHTDLERELAAGLLVPICVCISDE